jgi:hypothetical protein
MDFKAGRSTVILIQSETSFKALKRVLPEKLKYVIYHLLIIEGEISNIDEKSNLSFPPAII